MSTIMKWKSLLTVLMCLISRPAWALEQEIRCINSLHAQLAEIHIKYNLSSDSPSFESMQLTEIRVRGSMNDVIGASGPILYSGHDFADVYVTFPVGLTVAEMRENLRIQRTRQSFVLAMGFHPKATYSKPRYLHGELHLTTKELGLRLEHREKTIFGMAVRVPELQFHESADWVWTRDSRPNDYYLPRFASLLLQSSMNRTLESCFQSMLNK